MSQEPTPDFEFPVQARRNDEPEQPLFKLVIISSAAFLLTVLSMVATMMGSGESPLAKFINRNGVRMIGVEVVLIIVFGVLAMAADRRRTMLKQKWQRDNAATNSDIAEHDEPRMGTDGHG